MAKVVTLNVGITYKLPLKLTDSVESEPIQSPTPTGILIMALSFFQGLKPASRLSGECVLEPQEVPVSK